MDDIALQQKYLKKIESYYNDQGKLTQYPAKRPLREIALGRIADKFEIGEEYTEKQVNEVIKDSITFIDIEYIRRELIEFGLLDRLKDGSKYWRKA